MVDLNTLSGKTLLACLAALITLSCVVSASQVMALEAIRDNDGEMSGLFTSLFGPSAIYPPGEYMLVFSGSDCTGSPGTSTDLKAIYHKIVYRVFDSLSPEEINLLSAISGLEVIEGLELLIIGEYTNSRSLNFTNYDNHSVETDKILDLDLAPISDSYSNPFSTIYSENRFAFYMDRSQYYAIKIRLSDAFVDEDSVHPRCSLSNYNVDVNRIDGTLRHGYDRRWALKDVFGEPFGEFQTGHHPGPNLGGQFGIRRYGDKTPDNQQLHFFRPIVILRETSTGCPIPFRASVAEEWVEYEVTHRVVTNQGHGDHIPGSLQTGHVAAHKRHGSLWNGFFHSIIPAEAGGPVPFLDPNNLFIYWKRSKPYAPILNPFAGAVMGHFFYDYTPAYNVEYSNPVDGDPLVLVAHVKIPTEPGFPCDAPGPEGCPGAVGSELRYWSLTLNDVVEEAVYTVVREDLPVIDEASNIATIVFCFLDAQGVPYERPPELTPRFNWVHIPSEYSGDNPDAPFNVQSILVRMQLNDEGEFFNCSTFSVPLGFGEHTPAGVIGGYEGGGFMGDYIPQAKVMRLQTLINYQGTLLFEPDPVGGDCTTTYVPKEHPDEWCNVRALLQTR